MDNKKTAAAGSGGMSFGGVLTVIFVVLKLLHVIDWKWIWVLAPIWISFALVLLTIVVTIIVVWIKERKNIDRD